MARKLTKAEKGKKAAERSAAKKCKLEKKKSKVDDLLRKCRIIEGNFKQNLRNFQSMVRSFSLFNVEICRQIENSNNPQAINNFLRNWFGVYLEVKYQYYICKYGVILTTARRKEFHKMCFDIRNSDFETFSERDDEFRRNGQTVSCSEYGINNFLKYEVDEVVFIN
jgi:hypothetical protein